MKDFKGDKFRTVEHRRNNKWQITDGNMPTFITQTSNVLQYLLDLRFSERNADLLSVVQNTCLAGKFSERVLLNPAEPTRLELGMQVQISFPIAIRMDTSDLRVDSLTNDRFTGRNSTSGNYRNEF